MNQQARGLCSAGTNYIIPTVTTKKANRIIRGLVLAVRYNSTLWQNVVVYNDRRNRFNGKIFVVQNIDEPELKLLAAKHTG